MDNTSALIPRWMVPAGLVVVVLLCAAFLVTQTVTKPENSKTNSVASVRSNEQVEQGLAKLSSLDTSRIQDVGIIDSDSSNKNAASENTEASTSSASEFAPTASYTLNSKQFKEHSSRMLLDKLSLLTNVYGLPNFSGITTQGDSSPLVNTSLIKEYKNYLMREITFAEMVEVSQAIGFDFPAAARVKRLEKEIFEIEDTPNTGEPSKSSSLNSLTLEELLAKKYSEKKSDYETQFHTQQQISAKELEVLGARFCYELSRYIVNDFLHI